MTPLLRWTMTVRTDKSFQKSGCEKVSDDIAKHIGIKRINKLLVVANNYIYVKFLLIE